MDQSFRTHTFAFPHIAAALTVLFGLVVLAGWIADVPLLRSIVPGAVEMKANTALGLTAAGTALFILNWPSRAVPQKLATALAAFVTMLGLATAAENVFGWNLAIDELLFRDTAVADYIIPGRMSPYSTLAFASIGIALLCVPHKNLRYLVHGPALLVTTIDAISFIGYMWNAAEIVTDKLLPPVAINTAICFIVKGKGTTHTQRYANMGNQPDLHRNARMERKLIGSFIGAFLLVVAAGGYTHRSSAHFGEAMRWVAHTQEVRAALGQAYAEISAAELALRNYLLLNDRDYNNDYAKHTAAVNAHLQALTQLIRDNPLQTNLLQQLKERIADRIRAMNSISALYDQQGGGAARAAGARGARAGAGRAGRGRGD